MKRSLFIAYAATIAALTVVLGWMPFVFLVPMLLTCVTFGYGMSAFASLTFGVVSLIFSYVMPSPPVTVVFTLHPWMPIVPRFVAGMLAHSVYIPLSKIGGEKFKAIFAVSIAGIVGSLANTVLVGGCIFLFEPDMALKGLSIGYLAIMGGIEAAANAALLPPLKMAVQRFVKREAIK